MVRLEVVSRADRQAEGVANRHSRPRKEPGAFT